MAASFPGAVKTFATRTAGQTIDPSHLNDLQDEVNAIESGYLTGTAPITSSHASVTGLQVTGNSTLGSTITIGGLPMVFPSSGGSTGDVLMVVSTSGSTMRTEWRASSAIVVVGLLGIPAIYCRVSRATDQAMVNSDTATYAAINWTSDDDDLFGMHSTSANSSRINLNTSTGHWEIGASVTFDRKSLVERQVILRVNDSSRVAAQGGLSLNGINQTLSVATVIRATTSDYFTVAILSGDLGSTVVAHSTGNVTQAWAKWIIP